MKALIVTVAGTATRFNKDTEYETLKCLYYKEYPQYSLLYQILDKSRDLDKFVIVGGYLYDELISFIDKYLSEFKSKIELIYNPYFKEYGSGYSLIKGLEVLDQKNIDEIIFVEGDLFFDTKSYAAVLSSDKNVICVSREFIQASKAVALYVNADDRIRYIYDINHNLLHISEPIKAIYNSGQIWKFKSLDILSNVIPHLSKRQIRGTNLELIQKYFEHFLFTTVEIIPIEIWFNCNTVNDYLNVYQTLKSQIDI